MSYPVRRPFQRLSTARGRRWREGLALFTLLVISIALQGALSSAFLSGGFRPDLVLIVVVSWGLKKGWKGGLVAGLSGGFLGDAFSAGMLGSGAISLAVAGSLVVLLSRPLYRKHFSTKIVLVAGSCLISSLVYYLLLILFRTPPPGPWVWKEVIWPHFWQTVLIAPAWLWVAGKVMGE